METRSERQKEKEVALSGAQILEISIVHAQIRHDYGRLVPFLEMNVLRVRQ